MDVEAVILWLKVTIYGTQLFIKCAIKLTNKYYSTDFSFYFDPNFLLIVLHTLQSPWRVMWNMHF